MTRLFEEQAVWRCFTTGRQHAFPPIRPDDAVRSLCGRVRWYATVDARPMLQHTITGEVYVLRNLCRQCLRSLI